MSTWLPAAAAIIVSVISGYFTYRGATAAARSTVDTAAAAASADLKVKTVEVEAEAYARARSSYESGIKQLEEQIGRLRAQVNEERDASNQLRNQVSALEDTVSQLRRQLILSGIDVAHATTHAPK